MSTEEDLQRLQEALSDFVGSFELVFDNDWEFTCLALQNPEHLIDHNGTFLNPRVDDESNNWGNRGSLLSSYRHLLSAMEQCGISVERPWLSD